MGGLVVALFCFIIFFGGGGVKWVGRFWGMRRGKRVNWGWLLILPCRLKTFKARFILTKKNIYI